MANTRFVLFYTPDVANMGKAQEAFPLHVAHFGKYHAQGSLLSFGAFANLLEDGSMGIFTSREVAEEFVKTDPFVTAGIVKSHKILEWNPSVV